MPLEIVIGFDRDASCSGRDCLRRIEREDAGIPECARLHAVPLGSDRMGAILDERDLIGPAIFGDTVNIECDVPADVYDVSERRLMRSEEHTSELQSLMRISYAVFCLNKTIQ